MLPDDHRHGTYAGAVAHYITKTPTCSPCREAGAEYRRRRRARLYLLRANSLEVPAVGTIRRIQALAAIGHRLEDIDADLGKATGTTSWFLRNARGVVHRTTAERVAAVYKRRCMEVPDYPLAERARRLAAKKGWLPPLAWDDIDDPNEEPDGIGHVARSTHDKHTANEYDPAVVDRILSGDWQLPCTPAEKAEVGARWVASGGSTYRLEQLTGWRLSRYYKKGAA